MKLRTVPIIATSSAAGEARYSGGSSNLIAATAPTAAARMKREEDDGESLGKINTSSTELAACTCGHGSLSDSSATSSACSGSSVVVEEGNSAPLVPRNTGGSSNSNNVGSCCRASVCTSTAAVAAAAAVVVVDSISTRGKEANAAVVSEGGAGGTTGETEREREKRGAGAQLFSLSVVVVVSIGVVAVPFTSALISTIISTSCTISLAWIFLLLRYYSIHDSAAAAENYQFTSLPSPTSSSCSGRKNSCEKQNTVGGEERKFPSTCRPTFDLDSTARVKHNPSATTTAAAATRSGGDNGGSSASCRRGSGGSSGSSSSASDWSAETGGGTSRGIVFSQSANWKQVRREGEKVRAVEWIKAKAERQVENYLFTLWWLLSVCDWFISAVLISLCKEFSDFEYYQHDDCSFSTITWLSVDCLAWCTELVVAIITSTLITNLSSVYSSSSSSSSSSAGKQSLPPFLLRFLPEYPPISPPKHLLILYICSTRRLAALVLCDTSTSYFPYSLLIQLGNLVGLILSKLVFSYYHVSLTQDLWSIKCAEDGSVCVRCGYCPEGGQVCVGSEKQSFCRAPVTGQAGLAASFRRHSVDILNVSSSSPCIATGVATPLIKGNHHSSQISSLSPPEGSLSAAPAVEPPPLSGQEHPPQQHKIIPWNLSISSCPESASQQQQSSQSPQTPVKHQHQQEQTRSCKVRKKSLLLSSAEALRIVPRREGRKLEVIAHESSEECSTVDERPASSDGTKSEGSIKNRRNNNQEQEISAINPEEEVEGRSSEKKERELEEEEGEEEKKPGKPEPPPPLVIQSSSGGSVDQLDQQREVGEGEGEGDEEESGGYGYDEQQKRGLRTFSLSRCHSALHIVSGRTSSELEKMRRTSLPAALPAQRHTIHHGSGGVDTAILLEAHGLVTDMLMDHAALPAHIVAGLKALATLLTPPPLTLHYQHPRPKPAPLTLSTDPDYTSDIDEIPYTGEKIWNMQAKRNSGPSKKGSVAVNLLRRMSTSTWTTTTSATGMPTLEPQPHARRRRSASFRSAMDGTPGSSPTQPCSLVAIESSTPTSSSSRIQSISSPSPSSALHHVPNAALQASHKSRSFSANALYASTDNRRRYSQQELTSSQRKTLCSLHPLSPSDLTHLSALAARSSSANAVSNAAGTAAPSSSPALSGSPAGTPIPSPLHSPLPSRDPSPSIPDLTSNNNNYHHHHQSRRSSTPPKLLFHPRSSSFTVTGEDGAPGKTYLENPDDDNCSTASTLGDGPGPPCASAGYGYPDNYSSHHRHSPVTFTLQEPTDNQQSLLSSEEDGIIISPDGVRFDLAAIANEPTLNRLSEWDYPIFDLELTSQTQILSHMCYKVFLEVGLFETFKIPIKEFITYFHALEMGYRDKPYHNRMHAADVLHGVFYLTSQPIPGFEMLLSDPETPSADMSSHRAWFNVEESSYGIMGANFPPLELMAMYTAAAMHDYDHPGRTNAFLVTIHAPQAILYNDRSVLENHHAAAAWSLLLSNDNCNFLKYLDKAEFKRFRYLVIEAILATDLKRHFEILAEFNAKANEDDSPGIDWNSEADRLLVMEMCIKLADINGPCKVHEIHVRWTQRIAEEFYEQGDEEERLGLPISPYMDRKHPQLAKLQESFINHLVAPLCKACAEAGILPGYWEEDEETADEVSSCQETDNDNDSSYSDDNSESKKVKRKILCLQTKHLQDNHRYWMNIIKEEVGKKDQEVKTESVGISTEDPMETIEEENNTPHSLNRSFSFEKEDSKL